MNNEFFIRSKAMSIAKGFDSGLSSMKRSDMFDIMNHAGIQSYLMLEDIYMLHELATNPKYSIVSNKDKFEVYDSILNPRGFIRSHSGTNRVIYRHTTDPTFILKIGLDAIGIDDNKYEYYNQKVLKPFIPKVYDISKCGTVALMERVKPILSRDVFLVYADEIFNVITYLVSQGYLLEDFGTDFFMNWGIRLNFGPVLLDFPYIYRVNRSRLKCTMVSIDGTKCTGKIVYDDGFNYLACDKCGKRYAAKDIGSSFRYLNELNNKIKRSEENMSYVIKVKNNSGEHELRTNANVIVNKENSNTILHKINSNKDQSLKKETPALVKQEKKLFDNNNEKPTDKFVKNDNLKMEQVLKEFDYDINNLPEDLIVFLEQQMAINVNKYIKVSQFITRTKDIEEAKRNGKEKMMDESAKKVLHSNRIRIMENNIFTHYFSPVTYYDIEALADVIREALNKYKDMIELEKEAAKEKHPEKHPKEVNVEKEEQKKPEELKMTFENANVIGNPTITSKSAVQLNAVKANTASEY